MADDTKAVEEPKVEPQEPVPSSEAETEVDATESADLPADASERTKEQFNKLKEANKALKEQLDQKEQVEPIFESMRPKADAGVTQGQLDQVTDIDPATGAKYINEEKLTSLLTQTQTKADRAIAQVQEYEDRRQLSEAYQDYPQLDPKAGKFDRELFNQTEALVVHSMMRPDIYGGKQLTYKQAADRASRATKAELAKVDQEADAQQTAKEQGSFEATGRSDRRQNVNTTEEQLREKVRTDPHDNESLAALLGD